MVKEKYKREELVVETMEDEDFLTEDDLEALRQARRDLKAGRCTRIA